MIVTTLGTFLFVFMILLVKSNHSPTTIPFLGCAIIAGSLYAFAGVTSFLGGALNPAAGMAVIYLYHSQQTEDDSMAAHQYWWAYLLCPYVGAYLAGQANLIH